MWKYYRDLLARPVPRYTSYPTAADFHGDLCPDDFAAALDSVAPDEPVSLYVHIPFCQEICWYCGCNTTRSNRSSRVSAYLDTLYKEIEQVAQRLDGRGQIGRIAFGGGSPNALSANDFTQLCNRLNTAFGAQNALRSVEIDPRHFGEDWVSALKTSRVSHASLGVQTFDPVAQAAIGRVQPAPVIARATDDLRCAGIRSLNFDLMYGLPHQDMTSLEDSLDRAIELWPDRIALFGYAHVPNIIPRQRRIDADSLATLEQRFHMATMGHDRLVDAGYVAVGFDHFALPGDPLAVAAEQGELRRNFQGFTEDPARVLIGLGASAISEFPDLLCQNAKNTGAWRRAIAAGDFPIERGIARTAEDIENGRIIADLLCHGRATIGQPFDKQLLRRLKPFLMLSLIRFRDNELLLTPGARPYARSIASCFDSYRQISKGQMSKGSFSAAA